MARHEKQSQQAIEEQLEAEARARAVEEKILIEEKKLQTTANNAAQPNDIKKSKPGTGFQKPIDKRVDVQPPQRSTGKSLRDLADSGKRERRDTIDSGKRVRDIVESAANEAKYKVVVLKEGNKSELEGPLKDLLGKPKEAATRKNDNY